MEITKNKLNENIEKLQDNEEEIKKLNDLIEVKHNKIDELKKIKNDLNNEIEQKQEEIKIQKSQRREEMKKRNQAERNLRFSEIDNMTIPILKEILISNFGYDFDRKPYIKVADLRSVLIKEEGLTEKLKSLPTFDELIEKIKQNEKSKRSKKNNNSKSDEDYKDDDNDDNGDEEINFT